MDRFTNGMIGICICGCVVVICLGFGTMSYWMVKPEAFSASVVTRRDATKEKSGKSQNAEKPQRSIGGGSGAPSGNDETTQKESASNPSDPTAGEGDKPIVDTALSPRSPFILLSDEDKNKFWWEIAKASTRQRGDDIEFKLDTLTANKLARRFNCTPIQVMEFFRDGANAKWLKLDPNVN
jgi:hypothetical protein